MKNDSDWSSPPNTSSSHSAVETPMETSESNTAATSETIVETSEHNDDGSCESGGPCASGSNAPPSQLKDFHGCLKIPSTWCDQSPVSLTSIELCKISSAPSSSEQPLILTHCVTVHDGFTWSVYVHNRLVDHRRCSALCEIPEFIDLHAVSSTVVTIARRSVYLCWAS